MSLSIPSIAAQFEEYAEYASTLGWTNSRPNKEGYYWHRIHDGVGYPTVRWVFRGTDGRLMLANGNFSIEVETLGVEENEWVGPLVCP